MHLLPIIINMRPFINYHHHCCLLSSLTPLASSWLTLASFLIKQQPSSNIGNTSIGFDQIWSIDFPTFPTDQSQPSSSNQPQPTEPLLLVITIGSFINQREEVAIQSIITIQLLLFHNNYTKLLINTNNYNNEWFRGRHHHCPLQYSQ